jgi:hypothetical protein
MIGTKAAGSGGGGVTPPGPIAIVNNANTSVTPQGGDVYRATKTGGVDGADDASAISASGASGDLLLRVRPVTMGYSALFGLSDAPAASSDPGSIRRGIWIQGDGAIGLWDGSWGGYHASANWNANSRFFFRRTGSVIEALLGPSDDVAAASVLLTFTPLAGSLSADSCLRTAGGAFDIKMEAL